MTFFAKAFSASLVLALASSTLAHVLPERRQGPTNWWHYTPENGPLNWHLQSTPPGTPSSQMCHDGTHQSPIMLDNSIPLSHELAFRGGETEGTLEHKGSAIEVVEAEGFLHAMGVDYELTNFHFHTPSEHRINKEHFPMEMHMVHTNTNTSDTLHRNAVLGFVIQLSNSHPSTLIKTALAKVSTLSPGGHVQTGPLDLSEITEYVRHNRFWHYRGSLTTPPCSEGISWYVGTKPLHVGVDTYNALKAAVGYNARIIQNKLGRPNVIETCA